MIAESKNSRFPHADRVMDIMIASENTSWIKALGYVLLFMGAGVFDFPGAVIKAGRDIKNRLKKTPSV